MALTTNQPINGNDYTVTQWGHQLKVDMQGPQGDHTTFRVRVYRIGVKAPIFDQTSAFRDDLKCEVIGSSFPTDVGGYYWRVNAQAVSGVFVVTP